MQDQLVEYNGKKYVLLHHYTSDYCEIRDAKNKYHILLVEYSKLSFDTV